MTLGAISFTGSLTGRGPSSIGGWPAKGHALVSGGLIAVIVGLVAGIVLVAIVARRPDETGSVTPWARRVR